MPGVDIEVVRHQTGNRTKTIRLTAAHLLEYLRMKRVRIPQPSKCPLFNITVSVPDEGFAKGEKIAIAGDQVIEIRYTETCK